MREKYLSEELVKLLEKYGYTGFVGTFRSVERSSILVRSDWATMRIDSIEGADLIEVEKAIIAAVEQFSTGPTEKGEGWIITKTRNHDN